DQTDQFDGVIVVDTDHDTRLQRLVEARGMDVEDANARIAAQATDAQRREVADWVIDNSGTLGNAENQVTAVWPQLTEDQRSASAPRRLHRKRSRATASAGGQW